MIIDELPKVVIDNKELFNIMEQIIILSSLIGYSIRVRNYTRRLDSKFFCSLYLYKENEEHLVLVSYFNTDDEITSSSFSNSINRTYVNDSTMNDILDPVKEMLNYLTNK